MADEKKETVGKQVYDILTKEPELIKDPIDDAYAIRTEMEKDYVSKVENVIQEGTKLYDTDFFVVVEAKRERTMPNVLRNFIFYRRSCPTPHYGQTVYKYHRKNDEVEFIWIIPDKPICEWMKRYPFDVPESESGLLKFVYDFYDDSLLRYAQKLNGETTEHIAKEIYG